jgi:hypothetical protein
VAGALESGDAERAQNTYLKAREIDARVSGLKEAVAAGRETARLAPPRRRSLRHLDLYAAAADQIDLTVRDVRSLSRAALSVVRPEDPRPNRSRRGSILWPRRPGPSPSTWTPPATLKTRAGSP